MWNRAIGTRNIHLITFIFVMLSSPLIPTLRSSPTARGFLDGVNAGALELMLAVSVSLGLSSLTSGSGRVIFGLASLALVSRKINTMWTITGSAILGWLFSLQPFW